MKRQYWLFFQGWLWLVFVFILGRLLILQVVEGKYYRVLADENRVGLVIKPADRGIITDRHGEILVRNVPEGRNYLYGEAMAHVLGYLGEISQEELNHCQTVRDCQYQAGNIVGQVGIEKQYDDRLRGTDGGDLIEKDANGQVIRQIGSKEPVAGQNLTLTLDAGLQRQAYQLLTKISQDSEYVGEGGAIIISQPQTGEILALVSSPGFDPNLFSIFSEESIDQKQKEKEKKIAEVLNDKQLPMFNRAVGGEYPPGSTFKIVTAVAGLEEGKIDANTQVEDTGEIKIGLYRFSNWYFNQYGKTEGIIGLVRAIARSNDIFFYKVGEWLGITSLSEWARYFGLGFKTDIDIPGEANGLMPDPQWKQEYKGESWYLGDTYISAIGQGDILMTPLQVNQMTSIIASGGQWCQPHLLKDLEISEDESSSACQKLDINDQTLDLLTEGMKQVAETGGTAFPLFNFKVKGKLIEIAAKTGTAEFGDVNDKTHAWLTAFAPAKEPQLVMTVLLEAAGEGSYQAAPVAKELLEYWFSRQ